MGAVEVLFGMCGGGGGGGVFVWVLGLLYYGDQLKHAAITLESSLGKSTTEYHEIYCIGVLGISWMTDFFQLKTINLPLRAG